MVLRHLPGDGGLIGEALNGIDFGGTKIEAVLLGSDGKTLWQQRVANPGTYDTAVAAIADLVAAADSAGGTACTVGSGAPGSPSPRTGVMSNSNSLYLNGRSFGKDLTGTLRRPVRLVNDANCLALSEATDGAAAGARSVFALVIGTGVGGGIVLSGACLGAHWHRRRDRTFTPALAQQRGNISICMLVRPVGVH